MRELNKTLIGLGKVRNRITPSIEEFSILELKYKNLSQTEIIQGTLSELPEISSNISEDSISGDYTINLDTVNIIKVLLDEDSKFINLVGGPQGKSVYVEISNPGSYNLFWKNLRSENGSNPSPSITTVEGESSLTVLEIVRLGNFYYLMGIYREDPPYTLEDLVTELNLTFDEESFRIEGYEGALTERFVIKDVGGETLDLGSVALYDNDSYTQSGYSFILDIPKDITDIFYPKFIVPIIDKLEKDKNKYYINII